jgi:pimeloyl-ACP methyl ester carboxylesterase
MSPSPSASTRYAVAEDGCRIAYEMTGAGPALVVVEGALCHRAMGAYEELAPILADRFTVVGYDRRGRGESEPGTSPYQVQREVEDLIAVLGDVDPDAFVFGMSSGAALALEAARQGVTTSRLAVYEPPFILNSSHRPDDPEFTDHLRGLLAEGRRTRAVQAFLRLLGVPAPIVMVLPLLPMWKRLTAAADTLPNDFEIVSPYRRGLPLPDGHYASIVSDTLLLAGGKSPEYMRHAPVAIAAQIPGARTAVLKGQTHEVKAEVLAPLLAEHFGSR